MSIYRRLMLEQQLLIRAVRHRHDVHILELRSRLPPIAMSENVMPADFAAGLNLATFRDRPMKERVESRHSYATRGGFHMFEKCREPANDLARAQSFRDAIKFIERHAGFRRA